VPTGALPFFDKRPKFIQLALIQVVILNQVINDLLTMAGSPFKDERHCVLIYVKDPCASPNTVALGERFEHTIYGLFIGVETGKHALAATAESPATF
jgi:hypothetical protein